MILIARPGIYFKTRAVSFIMILIISAACLSDQQLKVLTIDSEIMLPQELAEISGMAIIGNTVFAINDSGNGNFLFTFDLNTGKLIQTYRLRGMLNNDWEELAIYNDHLYIGDFGNNFGNRKNLGIYRIHIDSLGLAGATVGITGIAYKDQIINKSRYSKHPWDCEAMIVSESGISCFTKERDSLYTSLYKPAEGQSDNLMSPMDRFRAEMLVTGACFDKDGQKLYLCGYLNNETYLLVFRDAEKPVFTDSYKHYHIHGLKNTQVESILIRDNYLYLASERTRQKKQMLYRIKLPL